MLPRSMRWNCGWLVAWSFYWIMDGSAWPLTKVLAMGIESATDPFGRLVGVEIYVAGLSSNASRRGIFPTSQKRLGEH
eukprot:9472645-Pyramimonas_sp.AAC.1